MQTLHVSNCEIRCEEDRLTLRMSKQQSIMTLIFFCIWLLSSLRGLYIGVMHHKTLSIVLCLVFALIDIFVIWFSAMSLRGVCLLDKQSGKLSQDNGAGRDLSTISAVNIRKRTGTHHLSFHFSTGPKLALLGGRFVFKHLAEAERCAQEISEFLNVPITHVEDPKASKRA